MTVLLNDDLLQRLLDGATFLCCFLEEIVIDDEGLGVYLYSRMRMTANYFFSLS